MDAVTPVLREAGPGDLTHAGSPGTPDLKATFHRARQRLAAAAPREKGLAGLVHAAEETAHANQRAHVPRAPRTLASSPRTSPPRTPRTTVPRTHLGPVLQVDPMPLCGRDKGWHVLDAATGRKRGGTVRSPWDLSGVALVRRG